MSRVAPAMSDTIRISSRRSSTFSMGRPLELVRVEAGFLVDRLDRVAPDARLGFLVHLDQRLLPLLLLIRRERDDLGAAALLHVLQRIVVFLLGDLVGVLGR